MALNQVSAFNLDFLNKGAYPEVDGFPMMSTPMNLVIISTVYLMFVKKIGPKFMENRKPFELKKILFAYNLYQVILSAGLCIAALRVKNIWDIIGPGCRFKNYDEETWRQVIRICWWYTFTRMVDLLDTVFFTLRKKQSQVSFLHVFHHILTMISSWVYCKYVPEEQGLIIGFLNSFVHIFMYSYYLLAALGPHMEKYLWWKRYITQLQLIQFAVGIYYLGWTVVTGCKMNNYLTLMLFGLAVLYGYLFTRFYLKTYLAKKRKIRSE